MGANSHSAGPRQTQITQQNQQKEKVARDWRVTSAPGTIQREHIRLIVFNEQDARPVYDTETIVHVADGLRPEAKRSKCGQFQFLRHNKDVQELRRLVFGTLSTSIKKGSLKIHTLPDTLLMSRIFSVPKDSSKLNSSIDLNLLVGSYGSDYESNPHYHATIRSLDALYRDDQSVRGSTNGRIKHSLDPPTKFTRVRNCSLQLDGLDYERAFSPHQLSRMRREELSQRGLNGDGSFCWSSRSRLSSCSSANENEETRQIGFALVFPLEQKDFIFQHILQLEEEIAILELGIHAATLNRPLFFQSVYTAYRNFCSSICLLHNAQRLKTPAWLNLMDPALQTDTALQFCDQLAELIVQLDRKESNFFISTLLSAVLMNHLAWVASVAPPITLEESMNRSMLIGTNVLECKQQQYNAAMAQFLELCGSVGVGCRLTKTVVIGEDAEQINQVLFILSYFIRCSNVETKPLNLDPLGETSTAGDSETLSPPPVDEFDEDDEEFEDEDESDEEDSPPQPSTSCEDQTKNTCLKRRSSSMSASSPPPSTSYASFPSTSSAEPILNPNEQVDSDSDSFEPPMKMQAISADGFKTLPPCSTHSIKLLMDMKDVRITAFETFSTTFAESFAQLEACSPPSNSDSMQTMSSTTSDSLSRSLLAGVCDTYSPHFILSGVQSDISRLDEINAGIYEDVRRHSCSRQSWCPHSSQSYRSPSQHPSPNSDPQKYSPSGMSTSSSRSRLPPFDSSNSSQQDSPHLKSTSLATDSPRSQESGSGSRASSGDECQASVVVIVGDLNSHTIRAVSIDDQQIDEQYLVTPSESVIGMLEQFLELHSMGSDPNFLISFLEDQLGSVLSKSQTLVELVTTSDASKSITDQLKRLQAFSKSDDHQQLLRTGSNALSTVSQVDSGLPQMDEIDEDDIDLDMLDEEDEREEFCMQNVANLVGCDCSDLRLILNVAAVYNPPVLNSVL